MKTFSKSLLLLLVLSLVLVGCSTNNSGKQNASKNESPSNSDSSTGGKSETIELDYWVPFSGTDGEFMEAMVKAFNESQSDIKVNFMNNNWDNFYTKLQTAIVSNSGPDVAASHVSQLASLIATDKVAKLDDLASAANVDWSSYNENQLNATKVDGAQYAVPLDTHAVIMYYNTEYLEQAGLLNSDGSLNIEPGAEGFTNMLRTLKEKLPNDVTPFIFGSNNVFSYWIWYALVNQMPGQSVYAEDGSPTVNTEAGIKAATLLRSWIEEGLALPDIGDQSYDIFKNGDAAVTFTGVWSTGNFETNPDLKFTAVPFPVLFEEAGAWGDSHTTIVLENSDNEKKVAALKFADWLADNGHMWAKAGHVPVKPSVIESEEYKQLPYRASYAAVLNDVAYAPITDKLGGMSDVIREALVEINYGHISVEEGLAKAQANAESIFSK